MNLENLKLSFRNDMTVRVDILREISINYNYSKYLFINSSKIKKSHWGFIKYNFFKVLIIDLAKLFTYKKDSQKFNFFTLFDKLETGIYKPFQVPLNIITKHRQDLNSHNDFLKTIKKYRDTVFAHTDKHTSVGPEKAFYLQLENIINLSFEILNQISQTVIQKEVYNIINRTDLSEFVID